MSSPVKVIIVGNTGVGKSFLANVVLGENKFEHKYQVGSCTAAVESDVVFGDDALLTELVVYNIPGLVEADLANIERNKKAIKEAFAEKPELRTVVLFVFSGSTGGRITNDDCTGWTAIKNFLQPEAKKYGAAIGFIVNRLDIAEFSDKASGLDESKLSDYCAATSRTIKEVCGANSFSGKITFVERIPPEVRSDMSAPPVVRARTQMMSALNALLPAATPITPDPTAEIELGGEKLKKEVALLMEKMEHLKKQHDEEMKQQSKEHLAALERIHADQLRAVEAHARELAAIKSELERSKAEIEKHKETLNKALVQGSHERLDGTLPLLYALMQRQQHLEAGAPLLVGGPLMGPMGGLSIGRDAAPHGGALGWNTYRSAAAQSLGSMTRAGQSQSYRHYKQTGQMKRF